MNSPINVFIECLNSDFDKFFDYMILDNNLYVFDKELGMSNKPYDYPIWFYCKRIHCYLFFKQFPSIKLLEFIKSFLYSNIDDDINNNDSNASLYRKMVLNRVYDLFSTIYDGRCSFDVN